MTAVIAHRMFRAAVPSVSTVEFRDGGSAYYKKSVSRAVDNVNDVIAPAMLQKRFGVTQQKELDEFMIHLDGTENK